MKLDKLDKDIIKELTFDARQPHSQIAKKLKTSKHVVGYRIKKLMSNKVGKFFTLIDAKKLGYTFYGVILELRNATDEETDRIINQLGEKPYVVWLAKCMGRWEIYFAILAKDVQEFRDHLSEVEDQFGDYIKDRTFVIDVDAYWMPYQYLLGEDIRDIQTKGYFGEESDLKLDGQDLKILKELRDDATISLTDMCNKLDLKIDTVKYRIKNMLKSNLIRGFKLKLDPYKLGYEWHTLLLSLNMTKKEDRQEFDNYARNHPNIVFCANVVGNWNVMIDLHVKNQMHLNKIVKELKVKFGRYIKSYENITIEKEYKNVTVPDGFFGNL